MKILFIGDVFGKPGRRVLRERVKPLRAERSIDLVVANGENAADGFGITPALVGELCEAGVDLVTLGDHVWDKRELANALSSEPRVLRPVNYPAGVPGRGTAVVTTAAGVKVGVISLQGRVEMAKQSLDEPFRAGKAAAAALRAETPVILVDFHGEATSEKVAMGWWLDGEVSAVIGTHTHVQTADARVLPKGTAYLTDAGMTGPADGVIGLDRDRVLDRFLTQMAPNWAVQAGRTQLCAALVEVDEATGRARGIERIFETHDAIPAATA